jgi:RHS repeat-associated protein
LTADHLGSPRINTDQNGAVTARHDYQPFGEEIQRASYGGDTVRKQFTSYERDNESGLDFAQARYYSGGFGRFMSVDPVSSKFVEPQSHNKYVYVQNNPLKYIDPTVETLVINGDNADDLVTELSNATGYALKRCTEVNKKTGCRQVGQVIIDKSVKKLKGKGISEKLANKLKNVIENLKDNKGNDVTVTFNTVKQADNYYIDNFAKREVDVGDVQATIRQDQAFGAGQLGHILEEYSQAEVMKANNPDFVEMVGGDAATHPQGSAFESEVVSELLKRPATPREGGFYPIEGIPQTAFRYGNFRYDVKFKSETRNGKSKNILNVESVKLVNTPQ